MAQNTILRDFILGYCQQVGGLIEPPAYGIDEVLLPDEVAARWGLDAFLRLTFDPALQLPSFAIDKAGVTTLHYGHPLVETIVLELRKRSADTRFFINPSRLEKPGLREIVEKLIFANARPGAGQSQRIRMYHYVCFNFKASLVSDEKREYLVPLWMHLQGGYRIAQTEIKSKVILDSHNDSPQLETAIPFWHSLSPGENPLSPEIITALLERSRHFILDEIASILTVAQKRSQHFLELDRARLNAYYTDLQRDLDKRLTRADEDRRPALESKLAALNTERQSKLADAEQKYDLRLDLELINLAIIAQPKIELDVEISKRGVAVKRTVAWDPVRHILEPLVCDVCGHPGDGLTLCESGHLAHSDCLAPQCVDCKRTFCRLCTEKILTCVVCSSPVCVHSLLHCKICGRDTCQKHATLCHAVDGQPRKVDTALAASTESTTKTQSSNQSPNQSPNSENSRPRVDQGSNSKSKTRASVPSIKKSSVSTTQTKPDTSVTAQRIQVDIEHNIPVVRAFALKKEHEIAIRVWELTKEGITANCHCEKGRNCPSDRMIHRPANELRIEGQLLRLIREFALEYHVPETKIMFQRIISNEIFESQQLTLPSVWKDSEKLAAAQAGFDKYAER